MLAQLERDTHTPAAPPPSVFLSETPHPDLQLDPLVVTINRLHLEVDTYGADEGVAEGVVGVAEQEGCFPNAAVPDDEQLEHVVKVLVRAIPLTETLVCLGHLKRQSLSAPRWNVQYTEVLHLWSICDTLLLYCVSCSVVPLLQ